MAKQQLCHLRDAMCRVPGIVLIVLALSRVATSADASASGSALQPNISSASVLARLTAQPKFAQQFKQLPNYRAAVDLHLMLHDMLDRQLPLRPAPTKVSDAQGVLLLQAAAGELKGWPLMVQVGCQDRMHHAAAGIASCSNADTHCICMQHAPPSHTIAIMDTSPCSAVLHAPHLWS